MEPFRKRRIIAPRIRDKHLGHRFITNCSNCSAFRLLSSGFRLYPSSFICIVPCRQYRNTSWSSFRSVMMVLLVCGIGAHLADGATVNGRKCRSFAYPTTQISDKVFPMSNQEKLRDLTGNALSQAIDRADVDSLIDFVKSSHCKEFYDYYERITRGQRLVSKPAPDYPDKIIALPINIAPEEYCKEFKTLTERWLSMKKRAVDRLIGLDIDRVANLMGSHLGLEMDFYVRQCMVAERPSLRRIVLRDIIEFAIQNLGVSRIALLRFFQLKKSERLVAKGKAHYDYVAEFRYYQRVRKMLRSTQ